MKILFLTPRNSKKYFGGVEGHVRLLTEELERRGHEVKELGISDTEHREYKEEQRWGKEREKINKFKAWGYLWEKRDLFRWADVIHVHDVFWWYFPFWVITKLVKRDTNDTNYHANDANKGGTYTTFHGWEGVCPPSRSAIIQKRVAAFLSSGTIGVGSFFEKWYGVKTDRMVWGVIDDRRTNRQIDKSTNKQIKTLTIVFLGRMEKVNGVEVVVEAMEKLINRQIYKYTNRQIDKFGRCVPRIIFVGEGSYRKQAEKFGKVTGMVKNPRKYLIDADVVIASSYMSMLEAAAMGKPVIAVANNELKMDYLNCHPMRKLIRVVGNAEELIDEIKKLKVNKDWEKRGKRWAGKQTPERLADEYEGLWGSK